MSRRAIFGLALAWALAGCSEKGETDAGVDAGPVDTLDYIDACTDEAPCTLTDGMMASDYVAPEGDQDPWTFNVPTAGKVLNVAVFNNADFSPIRLEVVLFGPDGMAITNQRFSNNGKQRVEIQLVLASAGEHKLVVRDVGNDGRDARNPYFIVFNLLSETDNNEPNDTSAAPTPLTAGTPISGTIGFQGDEDWFAFDVAARNLIRIEMSAPGESPVKLRWELWNPAGDMRLAESTEPDGNTPWPVEMRTVRNAPGRYLLRVMDDPADGVQADLARVYILTVSMVTEPDPQDVVAPNETMGTATNATPGQPITGYIASTTDEDWYKIDVSSASMGSPRILAAYATMAGASDVDLYMEVLMPDGRTAVCEARDADECLSARPVRPIGSYGGREAVHLETAHLVTSPGTYFVRIRDHQDNDFDTMTSYSVILDLPADPDTNENYQASGRGASVLVSSGTSTCATSIQYPWVEGYISYANDTDWYELPIPGPPGGTSCGPNGDWMVQLELQKQSPTRVELEAFFYGPSGSSRSSYGGYGKRCRRPCEGPMDCGEDQLCQGVCVQCYPNGMCDEPDPRDLEFCQYPDDQNGVNEIFGESYGDCFVVFREVTTVGSHFFRMSDLDRDDFDLRPGMGAYRFRVTLTSGCAVPGECANRYLDSMGNDLCGRP